MIALLLRGGIVYGMHESISSAELNNLGIDHVMVNEIPTEIVNQREDQLVKVISRDPLVIVLEDIPPPPDPPKTPEQIRLEALEVENADVWYELMLKEARIAEHDTDIADIWYEIMTTGGTGA